MKRRVARPSLLIVVSVTFFLEGTCGAEIPKRVVGVEPEAVKATADLLEDSAYRFVRPSKSLVAESVETLGTAAEQLDRWLARAGENGQRWRAYLKWGLLEEQLCADTPPDVATIAEIHNRYNSRKSGLELKPFDDVRRALEAYLAIRYACDDANAAEAYRQRMSELADRLRKSKLSPTPDDSVFIGSTIGWLETVGQVPSEIDAIRHALANPNFSATFSSDLARAALAEPIDDTAPIRDVILRTQVRGTGHTTGELSVEFLPSEERGLIDLIFQGATESKNTGYNGPVRVYSQGSTVFDARKRFWIDEMGLRCEPTTSEARTKTTITGVRTTLPGSLLSQVARNRARQQKKKAEAIGSRHAERRLNRQVDERAEPLIDRVNELFIEKFRKPLIARNLYPAQLEFSTTADTLCVKALQADASQLAASSAPPEFSQSGDITICLHQSLVNNLLARAIRGRTLGNEEVRAAIHDIVGELPKEMASEGNEDEGPWAIRFDEWQPITVEFVEGSLRLVIRTRRIYQGEKTYQGMNIWAAYGLVPSDGGFDLIRQSDLSVLPPGHEPDDGKPVPAKYVVVRKMLQRRFGRILTEKISANGFTLPNQWEKLGAFKPVEFMSDAGWLAIAWSRVD